MMTGFFSNGRHKTIASYHAVNLLTTIQIGYVLGDECRLRSSAFIWIYLCKYGSPPARG